MRVYRRKYKDKRSGKMREGRTWWMMGYVGGKRINRSTGTRDKRAAELIAGDVLRKAELKRAGIVDPFEDAHEVSLATHIRAFEKTMRARGCVPRYIKDRVGCIEKYVERTGAGALKDLSLPSASGFLMEIKATGVGARTVNRYYQALKQFGIWLVKTRKAQFDPFDGLKPLNEQADRRHVRRALTADEAAALIDAARTRPLKTAEAQRIHAGVTPAERLRLTRMGEIRALVYTLALGTGLRKGELRQLRWCDIDMKRGQITVRASTSKSRKEQVVPLASEVRATLQANRPADATPTDTVIPPRTFPNTLTFHKDLEAAGVPREDDTGRVIDFHAMRTTFISWLAAGGVHPRVAQALARHASIETTMARYTDLALMDVKGTVEKLPLPKVQPRKRGRPISQPRTWDRRGRERAS